MSLRCWFALLALLLSASAPVWATESTEADLLARINSIRELTDAAAAQQAMAELATAMPADRSPTLEYQWLSLQLGRAAAHEDAAEITRLTDALLLLADKSNLVSARLEGLIFRADQLKIAGKPEDGLVQIHEALALLDHVSDLRLRYLTYLRAGMLYYDTSNFESALNAFLKALPLAEQSGAQRLSRELTTLNNLGALYLNLRQPEKALEYLNRALPVAEALNAKANLAELYVNLGYALTLLERHEEAKQAYLRSLQFARETGKARSEVMVLVNLSEDGLRRRKFDEAAEYARQALAVAQKNSLVNVEAIARANLGSALVGLGQYKQGLQDLRTAQKAFQALGDVATEDLLLTDFILAAERAGEVAEANDLLHQQLELRKKLFSESRQRAISELQERFDATARQKQIELLERENKLQSAEIDNRRLYLWVVGLAALTVVLVAAVVLLSYLRVRDTNRKLQAANAQLADQSIRDPLTGLFNRRSFQLAMERRWTERERRVDADTSVDAFVLLDIDHFKRINDTLGHVAGDAVLIEVAKRLSVGMRDHDMVLRWGGEEFLLYLRGSTREALESVVARVLNALGATPVEHEGRSIPVTASAGFVPLPFGDLPEAEFGWERAVLLADLALYLGKSHGRNRAYGVLNVNGNYQDIAPTLEQDLANAIHQSLVTAVVVLGPGAAPAGDDY